MQNTIFSLEICFKDYFFVIGKITIPYFRARLKPVLPKTERGQEV